MSDGGRRACAAADVGIVGVGNAMRGDDAAGLVLVERLAAKMPHAHFYASDGDVSGLIDCFGRHASVVIVDATRCDMPAGSVIRIDALREPLDAERLRSSTHAFGLGEAVELARVLGALPGRLEVFAIVGRCFDIGAALSPEVVAAIDEVGERIAREFVKRP